MANIDRIQSKLSEAGIDALLVSDIDNVRWATGFTGSFGQLIVTPSTVRFLTDSRYSVQAAEQLGSTPSFSFASPILSENFLADHLRDLNISEIGFESSSVTYATYEKWREALGDIKMAPVKDLVSQLRMVKSPEELEKIRAACQLADACFEHILRLVRPGAVEFDLGLEIEFFFRRHGAELAFEPIVVSGNRSARPHGRPSEKELEKGDFVTFDFGAKLNGQCSDLTRTIVVGEPTERHREVYERVLQAQLAALNMMKSGVGARAIDAEARRVMGDMAQYFGHGLGHGLGSVVHDTGRMATSSTDILAEGQVWTVEPGIYIEGFGGVRIEDDVVVTSHGIEMLTHSPKELLSLPE